MKSFVSYIMVLSTVISFGQDISFTSEDLSINKHVDGTFLTPKDVNTPILAIIIADAGPIDRNGNQNFQQNNALKKLAEGLSNQGIATFRYDKRIVKQIRKGQVDPNISFDDFISDAKAVIDYFNAMNTYSKIVIIGHGQGSLVGMVVSTTKVDQFISIGGSGKSIDTVIIEQITQMDSALEKSTKLAFENLKKGQVLKDYPSALGSVFSEDVQSFMISWMKYDPQNLIRNLNIPTLIINGTKDLQVPISEAKLLKETSPRAELKLIENMNHVLFVIEGKELENSKSYNESFRRISEELITELVRFMKN